MNKYYYPLIFSGAAALVFIVPPAQASPDKPNQVEKKAIASQIDTQFSKNVKQLKAIATPQKPDTQFVKDIKKLDAIARSSKPAKKLTLSKQGDTFVIKSRSKSSKQEKSPQLLAQNITPPPTAPSSTPMVPQPEIRIEENGSQNANPNAVPNGDPTMDFQQQATPVAPVLPRAIAPPVGDMSVSNINAAPDLIDLGTDIVVPRLVLRQAPAREVLSVLARYAGINVVYLDDVKTQGQQQEQATQASSGGPTISLDLENESVQDVFNYVLLVSGLQANRQGRTIFVGTKLPDTARNVINRTIRLNQATASDVAAFLALQGAQTNVFIPATTTRRLDRETNEIIEVFNAPKIEPLTVSERAQNQAITLLKGLLVSSDARLNTINLVGEPRVVELATSLIMQADVRRRQVAVNVKVLDVNLNNTETFNTSFSFGVNDTFFLQDNGVATLRFGNRSPEGSFDFIGDTPRRFLAQLQSNITNGNAKILTDPTLVVQEGQAAEVRLVEKVLTDLNAEVSTESNTITVDPEFEDAGLTLNVSIDRIDDNGFVTLSVNPIVSAPGNTVDIDVGQGAVNTVTLLNERELNSGDIRLRDGQTLIVSGIIQESDRTVVSKVPILGDIPLLGALFRSTDNIKERAEVIILLTPQIVDDDPRSQFGYNYKPSPEASEMLQERGFNPQEMTEEEQEAKEREEERREQERERRDERREER